MMGKVRLYMKRFIGLMVCILVCGTITSYADIGNVLLPADVPVNNTNGGEVISPQGTGQGSTPGEGAPISPLQDSGNKSGSSTRGIHTGPGDSSYLGGAELELLAAVTGSQNLSCVIQTRAGSVIVVDGGLPQDADHLIETIQAKGGRVSAWLITHPHSDHIGALTEILNREPIPIEIDNIYYTFLEREWYENGQNMGRMGDLDNLVTAFGRLAPEKLHTPLAQGQKIQVDDVTITVMNQPFKSLENTFNNSSVGYRLEINGKRILFLGDMGWDAGQALLEANRPEDLKADVVQMSHHGQDGVEESLYKIIDPDICLWPTPDWLWDNAIDGQPGTGPWKTLTVRKWMEDLGVVEHYCTKDGDQILR